MPVRRTCGALVLLAAAACARGGGGNAGVPPDKVADFVHAVIAADRATYAEEVVHRLQDVEKVVRATEQFREEKGLPLPSQMLRMGAQRAAKSGGFRYALISAWAINKANMPRTDFETRGLEAVAKADGSGLARTLAALGIRPARPANGRNEIAARVKSHLANAPQGARPGADRG